MKYISQLDYPHVPYLTRTEIEDEAEREKGKHTTIKSSGCGLCSAIMVADRLLPNYKFELEDAIALAYEVKANRKKGTGYSRFAPAFAEKLGLRLETSHDLEDVRRCLRTGGAAVILVIGDRDGRVGLFTHVGHYMVIINEEPDGRFAILDPAYSKEKYEEEGRRGKIEVTNDVIVLSEAKYLEEEATPRSTPYYLFWRK